MPKIFGKEASEGEFSTLLEGLREAFGGCSGSALCHAEWAGKELEGIEQRQAISEDEFIRIADEADNGLIEETPGRLTIPELQFMRDHIGQFRNFSDILVKYGYSDATALKGVAQAEMGRYDWMARILGQNRVDLSVLPEDLRHDKHFLIALIHEKPFIYRFLSEDERRDPEFAVQCLLSNNSLKFYDVPDSLRFDPDFLLEYKERSIEKFGKNSIDPGVFEYLVDNPELVPDCLKDFQFWIDYFDGDIKRAFKIANEMGIIPMDILRDEILTRPDASNYYSELDIDLKRDEKLSRIAIEHDPETVLYLPDKSPLLREASTWSTFLDFCDKDDIRSYRLGGSFPVELMNDDALVNRIAATHPMLFSDDEISARRILSQLRPENLPKFLAWHPSAYALLDNDKKSLDLAKRIVDISDSAIEDLAGIYGAELVVYALRRNPEAIRWIPEYLLNLPEVEAAIRGMIEKCEDEHAPFWLTDYLEKHPKLAADLVGRKPQWLEDYGFANNPSVFAITCERFPELITTPTRMWYFLETLSQLTRNGIIEKGRALDIFANAIRSYTGQTNANMLNYVHIVSDLFSESLDDKTLGLTIAKYGIFPDDLPQDRISAAVKNIGDDEALVRLLDRNRDLPMALVDSMAHRLMNKEDKFYEAATKDPRILKSMTDEDWRRMDPYIKKRLEADMAVLAELYPLLPESMRADRGLAMKAAFGDQNNFYSIPKNLLNDEEFMIELCGWGSVEAKNLKNLSLKAQAAAIARYPTFFHLVEPAVRNNPEFIDACLERNIWIFEELTQKERAAAWPRLKGLLKKHGFAERDVKSWDDLVDVLKARSVAPRRVRSLGGWRHAAPELFRMGKKSENGNGHRTLVIASKRDDTQAFESIPLIDRLDSLNIERIDYIEVRSEEDVRKLLTYIRANGIKFDDVIIAGHGTRDLIALGGVDRRVKDDGSIVDNDYLDFSDFDDPTLDVSGIMRDDGQLILLSCSNGEGADKEDNMANRYASTLIPTQTVISSQVPTNIDYMDMDDNGRIQVYWMGARPYIVRGKKS